MSGGNSIDLDGIAEATDLQAKEISNYWDTWNGGKAEAKERWKETHAFVYATSTRETSNATVGGFEEDADGWGHSTHVPKITQIFDNLTANYMSALMPHEDWFKFKGEDSESVTIKKREVVESYLRTKHRANGFRSVVQSMVNDWTLDGNCFAMVSYVNETSKDLEDDTKETLTYAGPKVTRISPMDICFNPLATDFEHSPKIIRSIKTLGELRRDMEECPEKSYSEEAFKKALDFRSKCAGSDSHEFDKGVQLMFDGFSSPSLYLKSGYVEVLEFYGDIYDRENEVFLKNHVVTVIDRSFIVRSEPLKTLSGRPHIFHCGWRKRPDNLWHMSPLANLVGLQYMINHLENARADAFDQMLAPTRVLIGDVEEDDVESGSFGGKYRIPSGEGSVTNLAPDSTVLTADIQIDRKSQQMEEFAGSPRQSMGFKVAGEQTATEANILDRGSSRIFQNKTTYFEEEFLEKILNAEIEVARLNLNAGDVVKVVDPKGMEDFLNITKSDLIATGKLVPIGARHFARQNQLASNLMMLQQAFVSDPLMKEHFPSIKMAEMYSQLFELSKHDIVQHFSRVGEKAEAAKMMNAAETQVEDEDSVDIGDDNEFQEEPEE